MRRRIQVAEAHLRRADPTLGELIERHGPCTLMQRPKPHFHNLVWAIVNQQLSVRAAATIEQRLLDWFGADTFHPGHFARVRDTSLRRCGLSGSKIRYIRDIAARVRRGELDLDALQRHDEDVIAERLMQIPGIGRWTADMFLMFSLGKLDVLPVGDLALRKSMRLHYDLPEDAGHDAYIAVAEAWRPYRTVASWYIWAAVD